VNTFRERLALIEERMDAACKRANRARSEVRLMAVSKTHPASAILEAIDAGVTLFGENRVQEFERKRAEVPSLQAEVHLIGHLQSNKSNKAVELLAAVDTVDSLRLAERLNEAATRLNRVLPILIEIKLSAEETKTGLAPESTELKQLLEHAPDFSNLRVDGLMTVPPLDDNPETARACFRNLYQLREQIAQAHPRLALRELSMGMSGDFEIGIEEGSTLVRIGTALFGAREYPK
jgi:pyridoxal phosphate enzyme (YggS family)